MPVSWATVRENAFNDPSHDAILHHGYFGFDDRRDAEVSLFPAYCMQEIMV